MKNLVKFYERDFVSTDSLKKAYLKSCKWIANNIMKEKEFDNVVWKIEKVSNTTISLKLYFALNLSEEKSKNCKICKEFHNSFYINTKYNCDKCNLNAFLNKMKEKERISLSAHKKKLDEIL